MNEVTGTLSTDAGLKVLLAGSGLTHRYVGQRTVALVEGDAGTDTHGTEVSAGEKRTSDTDRLSRDPMRLAQVDEGKHAGPGKAASDSPVETQQDGQTSQRKPAALEQVVVTGSHIPLTAAQQAQPVQVYTRQDIDRSGQTTVADFLNDLPQVSMVNIGNAFQDAAGGRTVRLHGMPIGSTLVLIDGQRTEASANGYFDLSGIPSSAIERIEMIPVGSSAVYGSDALAGVINIVLKKNFDGFEANVKFGAANSTNDGTLDAAFGKNWDKGSVSLLVSEQRQTELTMADRALSASGDFTSHGGANYRVDSCAPANAYSSSGQVLSGGGQVRTCAPYRSESLLPAIKQTSALLSAHYEFAPELDVFTTVLYSRLAEDMYNGNLLTLSGGSSGTYVASAANPYNPYGQNVGVSWGYGRSDVARVENMERPLVGVRGELPGNWHWELTGLYSHDAFAFPAYSRKTSAINAALSSSDPATALNVFGGSPGSGQLLNSLYSALLQHFDEGVTEAQAILRGPAVSLPAGALQTVIGATYDHFRVSAQTAQGGVLTSPIGGSRNAWATFAETRAPLLASASRPADQEILAWSLAGRYDHSDDFGGKGTWQSGLEWRPLQGLLFRGSYGTAYRAPLLSQVYGGTFINSTAPIVDPLRGGASYNVPFTVGSNPHIQPETGNSKSLGLVYSGEAPAGRFESSLTWWAIDYTNYIAVANFQDVVSYPGAYPSGLVVRGTPTPSDVAKGYAGAVTAINSTYVNFGSVDVSGVDFESHYTLETGLGTWTPVVALSETYKYEVALRPGQPVQSFVSQASTSLGFAPRWKGNLGLSWDSGPWAANLTGRYLGSYLDYAAYAPPSGHTLGNFWLFDSNVRYNVGAGEATPAWLKDSYISVGAVNLFNRQPQFSFYALGFDPYQADMRGRFVYVQAGVKF